MKGSAQNKEKACEQKNKIQEEPMYFPNKREILIYNWLEIFNVNVKVYGPS